jgi:hypothetical protein
LNPPSSSGRLSKALFDTAPSDSEPEEGEISDGPAQGEHEESDEEHNTKVKSVEKTSKDDAEKAIFSELTNLSQGEVDIAERISAENKKDSLQKVKSVCKKKVDDSSNEDADEDDHVEDSEASGEESTPKKKTLKQTSAIEESDEDGVKQDLLEPKAKRTKAIKDKKMSCGSSDEEEAATEDTAVKKSKSKGKRNEIEGTPVVKDLDADESQKEKPKPKPKASKAKSVKVKKEIVHSEDEEDSSRQDDDSDVEMADSSTIVATSPPIKRSAHLEVLIDSPSKYGKATKREREVTPTPLKRATALSSDLTPRTSPAPKKQIVREISPMAKKSRKKAVADSSDEEVPLAEIFISTTKAKASSQLLARKKRLQVLYQRLPRQCLLKERHHRLRPARARRILVKLRAWFRRRQRRRPRQYRRRKQRRLRRHRLHLASLPRSQR